MNDIILHHYPTSPFAEKVRIALGIKGLSWRSVTIPMIMPKPDLMPLTGGYRKTPVMQIGADIYCDTHCILRELERRHPQPSLYAGTDAGTANALAFWHDRNVFMPAVGLAFGGRDMAQLPPGFAEDRAKMSGRPLDIERLRAAAPMFVDQLRTQWVWLEHMLADERPFLQGQQPTLLDCAVYHPCWFIRNAGVTTAFAEFPRLTAWMERVKQIGHGTPTALDAKEALAIAKAATPQASERLDANEPLGRKPGMKIEVTPDDTGKDPVAGELVSISPEEVVIRREDPLVGAVAVHFPRMGFVIKAA
ncbi:MAG TPA: glutathione S-transferase family protein [Povalibacter sp.]|uniref:glutathione S-transferase family protein n=1 Tax=Povalibacter sp. TaxID=1962978 RepID=UPI002C859B3C|nr:glutathione S-transferase family protein [Povalibacter sp.]HMN44151.1 glutathione S-transferase family protein [Povalibacter sp.]